MGWTERQVALLTQIGCWPWPATDPAAPRETGASAAQSQDAAVLAREPAPMARSDAAPLVPPSAPPRVAPARPEGSRADAERIARLDWPALREAVAACTACALCERRTHTVFGVGNEAAHWMIVGEAPGEQEDLRGEPFVGKAGQLLDNMLAAIGLSRGAAPPEKQVFIANTLKCRPPGNRNPQPEELAQCEPFLMRQVALVRPRIILAMGRFAVQSLLRSSEPVGRLRGQVHRWQGVPLIVTYHPAYLLRNPQDKARAWEDLCLALEVVAQGAEAAPA
jgi:DNA polymerase